MERTTLRASRLIAGIVVSGAVVAAVAWWAWGARDGQGEGRVVAPVARDSSVIGDSPAGEPSRTRATTPATDAVDLALPVASREIDVSPVAGDSPPELDGVEIEVVDSRDGRPCAGARLCAFRGSEGWTFGRALAGTDDDVAARSHARFRTDERGRARVRPRTASDWLLALHGESWGLAKLDVPAAAPLRITVAPREPLEVEVVDAHGMAASDVRIELGRMRPDDGRRRDRFQGLDSFAEVTSDANGRARLRGVEFVAAFFPEGELVVVASPRLATQVAVTVPPRDERETPLRMTLEPAGTLQVRLVDGNGEVVKVDAYLSLMSIPGGIQSQYVESRLVEGVSPTFPVGIGGQLHACVVPPGHPQVKASRPGPARDGESVVLDVVLSSAKTIALHGSVVLENGAPWSGPLYLRWLIPTEERGHWENPNHPTMCDADGGFASEIAEAAFQFGPPSVTLAIEDRDGFERVSEQLTLPELRNQESIDLGEQIVLRGASVVFEGVVVDRAGELVPDVHVSAYMKWADRNDNVFLQSKDGRFRLAADSAVDEISVSAGGTIEGWLADGRTRWQGGERNLRVVLVERGSVIVRALLPEGLPPDSVYAGLRLPEWRSRGGEQLFGGTTLANEREAALESNAGVVDVVFRCQSDGHPLVEVNDVVVEPGKVIRDPRLAAIDLRDLLQVTRLTLLDPDGAPATDGSVRVYEAGHLTVPIDSLRLSGKPVDLVTTSPVDLLITARGCRSRVVRGVAGDRTIQLERTVGVTVKLRFRDLPPLEGSQQWWVRLHRLETPLDRSEWPVARLDDDGKCEFAVDDPGDYEFTLQRDFEGARDIPNPRVLIAPDSFTIPAAPSRATLEIEVEAIE